MSDCPSCGLPPASITQDDETGQPWYMCDNDHWWKDTDGQEGQ